MPRMDILTPAGLRMSRRGKIEKTNYGFQNQTTVGLKPSTKNCRGFGTPEQRLWPDSERTPFLAMQASAFSSSEARKEFHSFFEITLLAKNAKSPFQSLASVMSDLSSMYFSIRRRNMKGFALLAWRSNIMVMRLFHESFRLR